jgi:hypothetical protein
VTDHKLLEDVHGESLHIPSQINWFLCNRPDEPLKASGCPTVSSRLRWKTSERQSNTIRTLGQSSFNTELDLRSRHCLGSLCKSSGQRGNMSGCCPAIQNIPVFRSNAERSYSKDRPDALPSRSDMDLIRIELRCFWKAIVEDRPDVANFHPNDR